MVVQAEETIQTIPSRNIDELKRLVITALDKNGVLSELRTTVKLHVTRAINEDNQTNGSTSMVHRRGAKIAALMGSERGQLLTELVIDFLRFYDLNDTLSMFLVEGNLPRLRPSETELATQCGFRFSPTAGLSVLEQCLVQQPGVHFAPQHPDVASRFDTHVPSDTGMILKSVQELAVEEDEQDVPDDDSTGRGKLNTSLEKDMSRMRRISHEINRISESNRFGEFSGSDASPLPSRSQGFSNPIDDNVLFESRESFKNLGESPARNHPIDLNDHIESLDRSPP